jgi:mannose-1-phosphate guanylyltransferase/phosphomannomutase
MKAVVMAGGEGTRLRPMTASQPKPLLPVVNRPIMEHVLRLLCRHGMTETVVTVEFLAPLIRNYFGDGEDFGVSLTYSAEETPLGTAGSVRRAERELGGDSFLVISGDALTDVDLGEMVRFHKDHGALVTVGLARVPNPLEFGITIVGDDGRVERFLEKPTWGQVFTDTVNTGIYVMEPEVFEHVPPGQVVDWSADVLPELLAKSAPVYGWVGRGYWEDVGTLDSYFKAQVDMLARRIDLPIDGFEVSPGVWIGEGADVDPAAILHGPLYVGDHARVEARAELREHTVVGSNALVKSGAFLHRTVLHSNVYVGRGANLRGCVIGRNTDVMRGVRIEERAVVGDECVVEEEALLHADVKVYPFKTIEAGAVVNTSVIWESRGQRSLFAQGSVSGIVNVEITPELVVRLASAYATTLRKGSAVTVARDAARATGALKRAAVSALTASAISVRDLDVAPVPVARLETGRGSAGGMLFRTSADDPEGVDIVFLDQHGGDLSRAAQRKLERTFSRQEFRRAFPGEIGDLFFPPRTVDNYVQEMLRCVDVNGVAEAGLKVVVDVAGGAAAAVLPAVLGRLDVDVLTVNNRLQDRTPTETLATRRRDLQRLGELVSSSGAAFGVRFDQVGERLVLVDDKGAVVSDDRALLVLLDLVAAERRAGRVALPVTTTRVAELVARFHGVRITWTTTAPDDLAHAASSAETVFAGDGRGGFVVPELSPAIDGVAAFVRLLGLVARTHLSLSQIDARIPAAHLLRRDVPTPWAVKAQVMREVVQAAGDRTLDTTDGVRVVEEDGRWVLVLPDVAGAVTHMWAEGPDDDAATMLLEEWSEVIERATLS